MKLLLLATVVTCIINGSVLGRNAQQNDALEQTIRKLDLVEADAILRRDFAALNKLLAEDFTVNNPRNEITKGREDLLALIRSSSINYSSFVREPETILVHKKNCRRDGAGNN